MQCPGCAAAFPDESGPTHQYMLSAPACWRIFGQILAAEYAEPARMECHRLTVDAYAVQHPGVDVPPARRSVAVHLSRLQLQLERGWPMDRANQAMLQITRYKDACEWLDPPSFAGTLTVLDVANAPDAPEHNRRVQLWAASVWQAWSPHHGRIRQWTAAL